MVPLLFSNFKTTDVFNSIFFLLHAHLQSPDLSSQSVVVFIEGSFFVLLRILQLQEVFLELLPRLLRDLGRLVRDRPVHSGSRYHLLFDLLVGLHYLLDKRGLLLLVATHLIDLLHEVGLHFAATQQFLVGLLNAVVESHLLFGEVGGVEGLAGLVKPVGFLANGQLLRLCVAMQVRLAASWSSSSFARHMWFTCARSFSESLSWWRCSSRLRRLSTSSCSSRASCVWRMFLSTAGSFLRPMRLVLKEMILSTSWFRFSNCFRSCRFVSLYSSTNRFSYPSIIIFYYCNLPIVFPSHFNHHSNIPRVNRIASSESQFIFGSAIIYSCGRMRVLILLLSILLAVQGQFIVQNTWKIRSHKQRCELDLKGIFGKGKGSALIFEGSNLLTIVLIHPSAYEYQFVTGGPSVIIRIDFGQLNPLNFGKVEGLFNVSVSTAGQEWYGMREMSYFGERAVLRLKGCEVEVSTEGAAYIRLILLSICLAGINILLLTVLVKRKRWSQVEPFFLMVVMGWQAKKILIFWFECNFFFTNAHNCTCVVIMKYLLIILTVKSLKIFAEGIRISNNILKKFKVTAVMTLTVAITVVFMPMTMLHLVIPASFLLQFRKYSRYSRLDFQVHYALINLNVFLTSQLLYRLLAHCPSLSPSILLLAAYSICCVLAAIIMGELYQYSPQNNRSSPCIATDFDNKRFCPQCEDELFQEDGHDGSKSKDRHDLSYELWKFGVAECGHVFHCECLRELLRLQQGCPLIDHSHLASSHARSEICLDQHTKLN